MNKHKEQMPVKYKRLDSGRVADFYFERSLDLIFSPGCFTVEIDHSGKDVGLPIDDCGEEHYFVGNLVVTDSGTAGHKQENRVTGQQLTITSRKGKETKVFTRTYADGVWSQWRSLARTGMYDNISTPDELLATVAGLVNENTRAKEVEESVKRTAVDISSLACTAGKENVTLTGKSMDGEVVHSVEIPVATTEKAGVMSAEDNIRLMNVQDIYTQKGYLARSMGELVANDSYKSSPFIFVDREHGVSIKNGYVGESALLVAFYDKDKNFISGINNATDIDILDGIPADAVYYRTSTKSEYFPVVNCGVGQLLGVVAEVNNRLSSSLSHTIDSVKELNEKVGHAYTIEFPNAGFINRSGKVAGADKLSRHSDKIRITSDMRGIYATCIMSTSEYVVLFFDKAGNILKDISVHGSAAKLGHLVFSEEQLLADSFVVQFYANNGTDAAERSICYFTDFVDVPLMAKMEYISKFTYSGQTLNILIFGDSITDNANITAADDVTTSYRNRNTTSYIDDNGNTVTHPKWAKILERYFRCSDLRNYALSGASYKDAERQSGNERQNVSYQITLALNDAENPNGVFPTAGAFVPDIVFFALGTNDGVPNDTYDSAMAKTVYKEDGVTIDYEATLAALDTGKFCEAVRKAFMRVRKQWPAALYFCILPLQRVAREQQPLNELLKQMAQRYSMIVVDGAAEMGIVRDFEVGSSFGAFLKDGLHPNKEGQKLFARLAVNAIKNNYVDMSLME